MKFAPPKPLKYKSLTPTQLANQERCTWWEAAEIVFGLLEILLMLF